MVVAAALGRAVGLLWLLGILRLAVLLATVLGTTTLLRRGTAVIILVGHVCVKSMYVVL